MFIKIKRIFAFTIAFLLTTCFIGCGSQDIKDKSSSNAESIAAQKTDTPKVLAREDIFKIEQQYMDSANIFTIDTSAPFYGDTPEPVGTITRGSFYITDIVEFINSKGELKKTYMTRFYVDDTFSRKLIKQGNYAKILMPNIKQEDYELSSIIFKRQKYNALGIEFSCTESEAKTIKEYLETTENIELTMNGTPVSAKLIKNFYHESYSLSTKIHICVIFDDKEKIDDSAKFYIKGFNAPGKRYERLQ